MADVIDVDENRKTAKDEPGPIGDPINCDATITNDTGKLLTVNRLVHTYDRQDDVLLSETTEVRDKCTEDCDRKIHSHSGTRNMDSWSLEMVWDGLTYITDPNPYYYDMDSRSAGGTVRLVVVGRWSNDLRFRVELPSGRQGEARMVRKP